MSEKKFRKKPRARLKGEEDLLMELKLPLLSSYLYGVGEFHSNFFGPLDST